MSKTRAREGGASVFTALFSSFRISTPPSARKKFWPSNQAGEKEGGWGEGIFARLFCAVGAVGWEAARLCSSGEAKPAKIVSLIEKEFCARPLKEKEIFAGFVRRQAASSARQGRNSCSKRVRTSFSNCDRNS